MTLRMRRRIAVMIAGFFLLQPMVMLRAQEHRNSHRDLVNKYYIPPKAEPNISYPELLNLVQGKIKYVFVFYQENFVHREFLGSSMINVVPRPEPSLSAYALPPWRRAMARTMNRPRPLPFTCAAPGVSTR